MSHDEANEIDVSLMGRIKAGDDAAFAELFDRHSQRVLNIVYRYLGRESEAEDLMQEVFMRIYKAAPRYEPTAKFTTWLYQIVGNLCLNVRRNRARRNLTLVGSGADDEGFDPLSTAPDESLDEAGESLVLDERAIAVREALQDLPENQRLALVLMHYEGTSQAEIGEALGMSANAAKQLCHRARESLKKRLEPRAEELVD